MSLLNDMLRDLHQRQALPAGVPSGVTAGVNPLQERDGMQLPRLSRRWLAVPLLAAAAAAAGYGAAPHLVGKPRIAAEAAQAAVSQAPVAPVAESSSSAGRPGQRLAAAPLSLRMGASLATAAAPGEPLPAPSAATDLRSGVPARAHIVAARVRQSAQDITFVLELDRAVEFRVFALDTPPRLVLDVMRASGSIPTGGMIAGTGPVEKVRAVSRGDDARLVLDLSEPLSIRRSALEHNGTGGHRLVLELTSGEPPRAAPANGAATDADAAVAAPEALSRAKPAPSAKRVAGNMAKKAVKLDHHEVAELQYRKATQLLGAGRGAGGEARLRSALAADPSHRRARELLGSQLLARRRFDEAEQVLREGLALRPTDLRLHSLSARLLVERGEPKQAIELLQRLQPPLADAPDYHAFQAALLQKTGRYHEAARVYRSLVQLRPGAGVWWMGLAMALEADGKSSAALEAYGRAADGADMSGALVRFVKRRMRHLREQLS